MKKAHFMAAVIDQKPFSRIPVRKMISDQRQDLPGRCDFRIEQFSFHLLKPDKAQITVASRATALDKVMI